ncbi:hypothetical protein HJG60_010294 [Phyllostomus discolor]|uniref:Uncharacterized protein n=1 Tax=Phyllostomus discolor TaxID=89673 RepID=A0A834B2H3_9CHIR|nr:hypothetical protein HJG60_010294 [Phyllostomus discolor]
MRGVWCSDKEPLCLLCVSVYNVISWRLQLPRYLLSISLEQLMLIIHNYDWSHPPSRVGILFKCHSLLQWDSDHIATQIATSKLSLYLLCPCIPWMMAVWGGGAFKYLSMLIPVPLYSKLWPLSFYLDVCLHALTGDPGGPCRAP